MIYVLLFILFNKINVETLYRIKDVALIYLIVSASSFLVVSGAKYIWGRVRFRALSSDFSEYTSFLKINFLEGKNGDAYRSFPSGHTNAATSILVLS